MDLLQLLHPRVTSGGDQRRRQRKAPGARKVGAGEIRLKQLRGGGGGNRQVLLLMRWRARGVLRV